MTRKENRFLAMLNKKYWELMLCYACGKTKDKYLSEDLVQETFLTACVKIEIVYRHLNPGAWLFNTLYKLTRRELDRAYRSRELNILEESRISGGSLMSDNMSIIDNVLSSMRPRERDMIIYRFKYNFSHKEIASITGSSEEASRQQFKRAIKKFRALYLSQEDGR